MSFDPSGTTAASSTVGTGGNASTTAATTGGLTTGAGGSGAGGNSGAGGSGGVGGGNINAGVGGDGGRDGGTPGTDGGCGCSLPGAEERPWAPGALALLAMTGLLGSRRRSSRKRGEAEGVTGEGRPANRPSPITSSPHTSRSFHRFDRCVKSNIPISDASPMAAKVYQTS